jgi:hypothetical protein
MIITPYRRARKLFLICSGIWVGACWLTLLSTFVITEIGSPRWLPLPWSEFRDYIEAPDGRVYVDIRFYWRVLCYDRDGNFIASYQAPKGGGGDSALAVDKAGHIYYRIRNSIYIFDSQWQETGKTAVADSENRTWILNSSGQPEYAPTARSLPLTERAVAPGELLFLPGHQHLAFLCGDGTFLKRDGNTLEKKTADGKTLVRYGTPWPLKPLVFPVPAGIGCALVFLYGWYDDYQRRRKATSTLNNGLDRNPS